MRGPVDGSRLLQLFGDTDEKRPDQHDRYRKPERDVRQYHGEQRVLKLQALQQHEQRKQADLR